MFFFLNFRFYFVCSFVSLFYSPMFFPFSFFCFVIDFFFFLLFLYLNLPWPLPESFIPSLIPLCVHQRNQRLKFHSSSVFHPTTLFITHLSCIGFPALFYPNSGQRLLTQPQSQLLNLVAKSKFRLGKDSHK